MLTTNIIRLAKTISKKTILVKHSQRALSSPTKDSQKFADFTKYTLTNEVESPYEEEPMQMRERLTDQEQGLIMGLNEFEQSVKLLHEKKYEGAEGYLKDAMKILKSAGQEKSLGYLYLLKRLGYVCFLNGKYAESEKYFKINADMIANVTKNPVNIFSAQRNLLLLYTYTNLDSAMEWGNRLMKDTDEMLPVSNKELCFLMGNVYLLKEDYQTSKNLFRNTLKMNPQPQLEAQTLNNLACSAWYHQNEVNKLETIPEKSSEKQLAEKDAQFIVNYFKECIEKLEQVHQKKHEDKRSLKELQLMENLFSKDDVIPKDFSSENEEEYFRLLNNKESGKAITNISEFLLEQEGIKGQSKNPAFWFRLGLKYLEQNDPEHLDRHLILLGLFYASNNKMMMAEGLYNQALEKMGQSRSYTKVMGMNFYGRMLLKNPMRESEATKLLKASENLANQLPYWYDKIEQIYLPDFDLE